MGTVDTEYLTVQQLADLLQVSVSTIYQWRHQGAGPRGLRVGRYLRFPLREVEAFLEKRMDP